jgi:cell division septal protein FtsQ
MSGRPIARRSRAPVAQRRSRSVRRASAGLSTARAGAALAMLLSAAAIYGVGASSAFDYTKVEVDGAVYTDPTAVEAALAGARGRNLFQIATAPLVAGLENLPTVEHARIDLRLPGTLAVTIDERRPVLVWKAGDHRWLVDSTGTIVAELSDKAPAEAAKLPVVDDRRMGSGGLGVGSRLDPVDVDAATRLASLLPADIASNAAALAVSVTDENGFVLTSAPQGWTAVFGYYTPSLRTTDLIPAQVRLLKSLLDGREATVDRVVLASGTDGTYTPRGSPAPSSKPGKSSSPKPGKTATPKPAAFPEPSSSPAP